MSDWLVKNRYGRGAGRVLYRQPPAVFDTPLGSGNRGQQGTVLLLLLLGLGGLMGLISSEMPLYHETARLTHAPTEIAWAPSTLPPRPAPVTLREPASSPPKARKPVAKFTAPRRDRIASPRPLRRFESETRSFSGEPAQIAKVESRPRTSTARRLGQSIVNAAPLPSPPMAAPESPRSRSPGTSPLASCWRRSPGAGPHPQSPASPGARSRWSCWSRWEPLSPSRAVRRIPGAPIS